MSGLPVGRPGQMLALGLTVLAVAVLWWGAANPLIGWYADRADWLAQRHALGLRMADLVATLPDLRRQVSAVPAERRDTALLQGDTDSTASATLQQRVQDMAIKAGVTLATIETLPMRPEGALRRIALRVTAAAPWASLVHLLAAIEQADPIMSIDELALRASTNLSQPRDVPIAASFSVIAFRSGGAP